MKVEEFMKEKVLKSIFLSGIAILLFIVINILISSLMFIFKVSISKYYAIISLFLSIGIVLL